MSADLLPESLLSLPPAMAAWIREPASRNHPGLPAALRRPGVFTHADPSHRRLGSGGGTVHLLHQAWREGGRGLPLTEWLRSAPRLILHAGGESRRLPAYAATGKILLPLPLREEIPAPRLAQTLADLQIPLYHEALVESGSSALLASGDVWLDFNGMDVPETHADFAVIGMTVDAALARDFGVVFTPKGAGDIAWRSGGASAIPFDFFLQKPAEKEILRLTETHDFQVDTGLWFLSARALEKMFQLCGWDDASQKFATEDGFPKNLDFYATLACALGRNPSDPTHPLLNELQGLTSAVIPMPRAAFHHLGTSRQLFTSMDALQDSSRRARRHVHLSLTPSGPANPPPSDQPLWLDSVAGNIPETFEGWNVLSQIPKGASLSRLGRFQCLSCPPVPGGHAFRAHHLDDSFRGKASDPASLFCGKPVANWLQARGLEFDPATDLFQLPLFPVLAAGEITQSWLDWFFAETPDASLSADWRKRPRLSAAGIDAAMDLGRVFELRSEALATCLGQHFAQLATRSDPASYSLDFADLARLARELPGADAKQIRTQARSALGHARLTEHAARLQVFLRDLAPDAATAELEEKAAFDLLRRAILDLPRGEIPRPVLALKEDQIVWARSPVRLDLAGGWTDTPPHCFEHGGSVLNVAVLLNGQPPIQVFVRPTTEFTLRLHSIDQGTSETVSSFEELGAFNDPKAPFSLAKAALCLAGFHPAFSPIQGQHPTLEKRLRHFGSGLEVSLLCAVPKGSGLGTSSILATTLLAALARAAGLDWDRVALFRLVLALEQLLTTGGGWQDQAGALWDGVKLIETQPGYGQLPSVRHLPSELLDEGAGSSILLYYTGLTRLAKNLLAEIVRDMFRREADTVLTVGRIRSNAHQLYDAFLRRDRDALLRCVRRSWRLNRELDAGTTSPAIDGLLRAAGDDLAAAKLLGAGGGGYLLLFCRDQAAAARVRDRFERNPPNPRARFVDFTVAREGLRVTVS